MRDGEREQERGREKHSQADRETEASHQCPSDQKLFFLWQTFWDKVTYNRKIKRSHVLQASSAVTTILFE